MILRLSLQQKFIRSFIAVVRATPSDHYVSVADNIFHMKYEIINHLN